MLHRGAGTARRLPSYTCRIALGNIRTGSSHLRSGASDGMQLETIGLMARENVMSAFDAIYGRRAVRSFKPDRLKEETVRQLLQAAVYAPTAVHLEPWAFLVLEDESLLRRISERAKARWPKGLTQQQRHHEASLPEMEGFARRLADPAFNIFYDASTLIVIGSIGQTTYSAADCWLAAENLMLAACALGLGTCCIGSAVEALNAPETRKELGSLPSTFTAVAPLIVGVPREVPPPTSRKPPRVLLWRKASQ
jgi:nitroreductase